MVQKMVIWVDSMDFNIETLLETSLECGGTVVGIEMDEIHIEPTIDSAASMHPTMKCTLAINITCLNDDHQQCINNTSKEVRASDDAKKGSMGQRKESNRQNPGDHGNVDCGLDAFINAGMLSIDDP